MAKGSGRSAPTSRAARAALLAGVAWLAAAGPAGAQTVETADSALGEVADIIVRARLQAETLQEVPVTVNVIGRDTLEQFGVNQVADVASRIPTLNVQVGGSGSGAQLSLRGVGSSNISAAFDSAVALDFDGVQVSTMRILQAGFTDAAQIDVLRGPQSLYFGKSASAGVLSIKSADPTPDWEVSGRASWEFEEKGWLVGGHVSGPLSDTLGIRVALQYNDIDEFQKMQEGTPAVNQTRGLEDFVGRLTLQWDPVPELSVNFKFQYTEHNNDGAIGTAEVNCGANGRADEVVLFSGAIAIPAGYDCKAFDQRYFLPDSAQALAPGVPPPSKAEGRNGVPFGETRIFFGRLRWDADVTDELTVTSVTGYLDLDAQDYDSFSYAGVGAAFSPLGLPVGAIAPALAATNGPGVPLGVGTSDPINRLEQFTQELRLASNFDGRLNFTVGGFYEWRKFTFDTSQNAVNISLIAPDPTLPLVGGGVAQGTGFTFDYNKIHLTKTEAFSLFGSITYELTEKLEISGGARYTDENKVQTISVPYVHNLLAYVSAGGGLFRPSPVFVQSGFFSGPIEFNDSNWSPEVTLRYQATEDFNVFAAFKTGFKSGGIDNSALPSNSLAGFASPDPAVRQATADALIFDSETAIGGEVGFKSRLANRSVTFNGTVYYYVFDDLQVQNFNATTIQFVTSNAGQVTTSGVDLSGAWNTPVDGLSLSANWSYLNAKYTADFIQPGPDGIFGTADDVNLDGRRASQAPKWAGNIAADWRIPLGTRLELGLGGNLAYNDGYLTDEATLDDDFFQDSFITIDASVSLGTQDGRWQLSVYGTNLTDKIFAITSGGRPFLAGPGVNLPRGDDFIVTQNRGRQVFIEGRVNF